MPLERHPGHWRWVGGPVPPGAAAITVGRLVCVRTRSAGNRRLLRHELAHVEQWRRLGHLGFLRRYLGGYLAWRLRGHRHRDAYRRIPLEVEAEWQARTGRGDRTGARAAREADHGSVVPSPAAATVDVARPASPA